MENSTLIGTDAFKKLIFFFLIGLFALSAWSQTVTTDKDDYAPGEFVIITGSGWEPGEQVDFTFEETPKPESCVNSHDNFTIADANGNIYYDGFLIKENHLGVTFTLTATGEYSGLSAQAIFTDAGITNVSIVEPTNFCPGNSITVNYDAVASGQGNFSNDNIFTAQLSDENGSFNSPVDIGSVKSKVTNNEPSISAIIPSNITPGVGYLVRVVSSDVVRVSTNNVNITIPEGNNIQSQPLSQILTYGSEANFSISTLGSSLSYQWEEFYGSWSPIANGGIYSGATTSTLTLIKPGVSLSGRKYRVVVTGSCGTVTSDGNATLTVNKKSLTATSTVSSKIYDGSPSTGVVSLGTINGLVGSETLNITTSATNFADSNVGIGKATTISYSLADGTNGGLAANYNMAALSTSGNISKRPITITADGKTKIYGDVDPELTAQITSGTIVGTDAATGLLSRSTGENVGSYSISKSTYTYGGNYDETFVGANLVIGQRAITITADAKIKTYGDIDPELTAQATNVVNSDLPIGSLERATGENVGSYSISKSTYTYGSNYDETFVGANLVIGQRPITITADAKTKTYGDTDPELTAQITSGTIVGTDAATGLLSRAAGENVGSYAISKSTYTYGSNYDETFVGANLVIGQRAITITADAKTKTYGDVDPALTAKVTTGAIVGTDAATGLLSRATGENVGSYAISKSTYTYGSNYDETFVGANLVIGQRAITITPNPNQYKYCGQADPTFGYSSSETLISGNSFSGELNRLGSNEVGAYGYTLGTLGAGSNYLLTLSSINTFTIKGIAIDASASSNPVGIGSIATLSATVTPNVPGVIVNFYLNDVLKGNNLTNNLGVATLSVPNLSVDVYKVRAVAGIGCSTSDTYLPVYDPNGGFVTGGGWIESPANAMSSGVIGKANFGFNAKYKSGKNNINEVDGNTNFQFKAGDLNFSSTKHNDMELVISGAKATYTGTGTVNGSGNHKFRVVAIDGDINGKGNPDKFRIKIWANNSSSDVLYDNQRGSSEAGEDATILGGGSVVIHKPQGKSQESTLTDKPIIMQDLTPETLELLAVSPNPVVSSSTVRFSVKEEASVLLQLYDYSGRLIETLFNGSAQSYKNYDVDFERKNLMSGIYILKLSTNGHSYDLRLIIQ